MSFKSATRQNFTELPSQPFVDQGRISFRLPNVGLLSRLWVTISGTTTVTLGGGTAAISERTAYNMIKRIRLIANSGANIYDVTGYGTYVLSHLLRKDNMIIDSVRDQGYKADVYNAPTAAGANTWKLCLEIPVAMNEKDGIGLLLLQNNATQVNLEVEMNPMYSLNNVNAPILVTGAAVASFAGSVGATMEYFTVPRAVEDYPPLNVLHQIVEQTDAIASNGVWNKSLLRGNTYMRIIHYMTLNNLLDTTNVDKLRILYNQAEVPYTISKLPQLNIQRARYGIDLPKGTFVHDFACDGGYVGLSTSRDFINSANVTEFQTELTINSGASVPAGSSFINTITEQLISLA